MFPERSSETKLVSPVPVKEVSLLLVKANEVRRVFPLILRVVRLGKSTPVNPVLRPAFVNRLFCNERVMRLVAGLLSMVCALNAASLLPERSSVTRAVSPVPVKEVSLLLVKVKEDMRGFPLILSVVRAGR